MDRSAQERAAIVAEREALRRVPDSEVLSVAVTATAWLKDRKWMVEVETVAAGETVRWSGFVSNYPERVTKLDRVGFADPFAGIT
jgi:hypothetical protein